MNQAEALRRAMVELGYVSTEELAAYIATNYGVTVRPQFVPILKATLKDKEIVAEWRRRSQANAGTGVETQPGAHGLIPP